MIVPVPDAYHEVKDDRQEEGERDEGERRPQPIRAMSRNMEVGVGWVELESFVAHCVE